MKKDFNATHIEFRRPYLQPLAEYSSSDSVFEKRLETEIKHKFSVN